MQLDSTSIAIRERGLLDTCDLALHVVRRHIGPLILTFSAGAIPLMLLNHALLGWMMDVEYRDMWFYTEETGAIFRFLWDMMLLVVIEAPLASIFATKYLGQAVFLERPLLSEVFLDVLKMLPRVAWCQLLVRGILATWLLVLTLDRYGDFHIGVEILLLGGIAVYASLLRAVRPFNNEIVLLERNPLRSNEETVMTVGRRSWQLHGPSSADLFGRWLGTALFAVLLTAAVMGAFIFLSGVFLHDWKPGPIMISYGFPLSMWIVAGYLTVVRFLSYVDLRIRHEGWEVELRMRAEATRLQSTLT
ncbi:MAG: hypothetical protein ACC628_24410 [Pirellulaceae bacterium]